MHERVDAVLDRLDEMNNGEISYEVYRELHDLVSMIPDPDESPTNLPTELFPGTQDALNALTIRDAEPEEWEYARRSNPSGLTLLVDSSREEAERRIEAAGGPRFQSLVRRRKAGPWMVICDD